MKTTKEKNGSMPGNLSTKFQKREYLDLFKKPMSENLTFDQAGNAIGKQRQKNRELFNKDFMKIFTPDVVEKMNNYTVPMGVAKSIYRACSEIGREQRKIKYS